MQQEDDYNWIIKSSSTVFKIFFVLLCVINIPCSCPRYDKTKVLWLLGNIQCTSLFSTLLNSVQQIIKLWHILIFLTVRHCDLFSVFLIKLSEIKLSRLIRQVVALYVYFNIVATYNVYKCTKIINGTFAWSMHDYYNGLWEKKTFQQKHLLNSLTGIMQNSLVREVKFWEYRFIDQYYAYICNCICDSQLGNVQYDTRKIIRKFWMPHASLYM